MEMEMKKEIDEACRLLSQGEPVALCMILEHHGSTPRSAGTRMLVRPDGTINGTIGGGLLEAQVIEAARAALARRASTLHAYHFNEKEAGAAGMICGGSVKVLVQYMPGGEGGPLGFYRELAGALRERRKAWLFTHVDATGGDINVKQALWMEGGRQAGDAGLSNAALQTLADQTHGHAPVWQEFEGQRVLVEPMQNEDTVIIFGAGHVSQMLAALTAFVGFNTVVLDDREEFANRQRFPAADQVIALPGFDHMLDGLEIDKRSYLVIVTRGHQDDLSVLRQALGSGAGYIGMIGSLRKRDLIYKALREEGVPQAVLDAVHSPIGLPIGAETPEEIAVSILAELIQVRAGMVE
jgi:xanthine dehydrogenase accessory factor